MQFLEGGEASVSVCSRARRALFRLVHQHLCARAQGRQRDCSAPEGAASLGQGFAQSLAPLPPRCAHCPDLARATQLLSGRTRAHCPPPALRLAPGRPCRWSGPSPLARNASRAAGRALAHGRLHILWGEWTPVLSKVAV